MKNARLAVGAVAVTVFAVAATACGSGGRTRDEDASGRGITDSEVVVGTSGPITGSYAGVGLYTEGARAYFDYLNDTEGGVEMADGKTRKIEFKIMDDAYDPARALENARSFVENDNGYAMFMIQGTPTGLATRQYLNDNSVPNLVFSGATDFSGDPEFPWTMGFPMAYTAESAIIADILESEDENATVATLNMNVSSGVQFMDGFKQAIEGSGIEIVAEETFEPTDPSVDSQMTNILRAQPDVFLEFSNGKFVAQALQRLTEAGFSGRHFLNSTGSTVANLEPAGLENAEGITTVQWSKDPSDPSWDKDEDMQTYQEIMSKYRPSAPADDTNVMYGFVGAQLWADALSRSDTDPQSLVDAWYSFDGLEAVGLLDGVTVTTGPDDPFVIESGYAQTFEDGAWNVEGEVRDGYEGATPVG